MGAAAVSGAYQGARAELPSEAAAVPSSGPERQRPLVAPICGSGRLLCRADPKWLSGRVSGCPLLGRGEDDRGAEGGAAAPRAEGGAATARAEGGAAARAVCGRLVSGGAAPRLELLPASARCAGGGIESAGGCRAVTGGRQAATDPGGGGRPARGRMHICSLVSCVAPSMGREPFASIAASWHAALDAGLEAAAVAAAAAIAVAAAAAAVAVAVAVETGTLGESPRALTPSAAIARASRFSARIARSVSCDSTVRELIGGTPLSPPHGLAPPLG